MPNIAPIIVPYVDAQHRTQVVTLWQSVFGYETAHNEPNVAIDHKLAVDDGLFFVATDDGVEPESVIGTVLAGYDGHRGWIYSLAVHPDYRKQGIGSALLQTAEQALDVRGCLKINLQILADNNGVQAFYRAHGYVTEERISMGKKLLP